MENEELYRLFERVRGGDKQAFSELYHDLKAPVYTKEASSQDSPYFCCSCTPWPV